jgi:predicted nuclease of predicted toxin-antitoxin system
MNLTPRWVDLLVLAGFDAIHWTSAGAMDAPDVEIMRHAAANDMIVLTQDLDFGAMLAASHGNKPSVVQIRADDTNSDRIGDAVVGALRQTAAELAEGAIVTVEPGRRRLTLLPLRRS